jgi:hypothetical protein
VTFHERFSGFDYDIWFGRSVDDGQNWTFVRVDSNTGTEFNPMMAVDPSSGAIAIAYYTTDGDQTTGNDDVRMRLAVSADTGNSWTRGIVSPQTSNETGGQSQDYLEYHGLDFRDGTAHVLWPSRYPTGGTDLDAFTASVSFDSSTNNNILHVQLAASDNFAIRSSPLNNSFVEVFINGLRTYTGLAATIDTVLIEGTDSPDFFTIDSLSGVSNVIVNLKNGNDEVTIHPRDAVGRPTINVPIEIFGDGGNDTVYIDDSATSSGALWTINNSFDALSQTFALAGGSEFRTFNTVENVYLKGSQNNDEFNVEEYFNGSALRIEGNGGADVVSIAPLTGDIAASIFSISYFNYDGGPGHDYFNLANGNNPQSWSYLRGTDLVRAQSLSGPAYYADLNFAQGSVETTSIAAGPQPDQFFVTTLPTGTVNNLYGGGGSDEYVLRNVFTTAGIGGGVQVFEYSGTNGILVDNYFGTTGTTFHIENGSVGAAPGDNLFGLGGYLTYYGDFELTIRLSNNGADTVYAAPDPTTTFILDGSNPTSFPGDLLEVTTGLNYFHTPNGPTAGTYTFTGAAPITYSNFETTTIVTNTPPTTSGIPTVNVLESAADFLVDLWAAFADAQDADSQLTYTVQDNTNPGLFTSTNVNAAQGVLVLDFASYLFGSASITVRATDTANTWVETSFTVNVAPVANQPIGLSPTTYINQQTTYGLAINPSGLDGPEVTHFHITNIANGTLYQNDGITPISEGQFITVAQGGLGLKFTPALDSLETGYFYVQGAIGPSVGQIGAGVFFFIYVLSPPELPGDYNLDGTVDAADYVIWRRTLGQTTTIHYYGADGDGDGIVDQDDFDVWRSHFGETMSPLLPGDYNRDEIVDGADYVVWRKSLNQTVARYSGADGDGDGTVDHDDFLLWRAYFGELPPGTGGGAVAATDELGARAGIAVMVDQAVAESEADTAEDMSALGIARSVEAADENASAVASERPAVVVAGVTAAQQPQEIPTINSVAPTTNAVPEEAATQAIPTPVGEQRATVADHAATTSVANSAISGSFLGAEQIDQDVVAWSPPRRRPASKAARYSGEYLQDEALMAWLSQARIRNMSDRNLSANSDAKADVSDSYFDSRDQVFAAVADQPARLGSFTPRGARLKVLR